jgi:hypothetical protein
VAEAALDGFQQAPGLLVSSWKLNTNELVVFLGCAVRLSVGIVVDVTCNFLGEAVSLVTELLVVTVHLIRVLAVSTLAGVHFKVVGGPAFGGVDWPRDSAHGIV